jgi:hypothetical protein
MLFSKDLSIERRPPYMFKKCLNSTFILNLVKIHELPGFLFSKFSLQVLHNLVDALNPNFTA